MKSLGARMSLSMAVVDGSSWWKLYGCIKQPFVVDL